MQNFTFNQFAARTTVNLVLSGTTAILSMFGTIFILVTYLKFVTIQTTSRRILVYISVADFFLVLGNFVGIFSKYDRHGILCLVQSIVVTFSSLSSFFWTVFMALYLYYVCSRRTIISREALFRIFHIIGWGVPFVITAIAAFWGKLGFNADIVTSGWCSITKRVTWDQMKYWMLITSKFWEILAYFTITVLYILVTRAIQRQYREQGLLEDSEDKSKRIAEMKLIVVPIVFITLHIWGTIRFFVFVQYWPKKASPDTSWLLYLQGIGDNGQGFANFLIFCFCTEKTQEVLGYCFRKCFRRCRCRQARKHVTETQVITSSRITIEPQVKYGSNKYNYADLS